MIKKTKMKKILSMGLIIVMACTFISSLAFSMETNYVEPIDSEYLVKNMSKEYMLILKKTTKENIDDLYLYELNDDGKVVGNALLKAENPNEKIYYFEFSKCKKIDLDKKYTIIVKKGGKSYSALEFFFV